MTPGPFQPALSPGLPVPPAPNSARLYPAPFGFFITKPALTGTFINFVQTNHPSHHFIPHPAEQSLNVFFFFLPFFLFFLLRPTEPFYQLHVYSDLFDSDVIFFLLKTSPAGSQTGMRVG